MTKKDAPKPRSRGQPSKYKPEYIPLLKKHFEAGLSYDTFPAVVGVALDTLYEWEKVHQDFSEAKREYLPLAALFWEQIGTKAMKGQMPGFLPTIWIFNMKNRFKWHDNVQVQHQADPQDTKKDVAIERLSAQLASLKALANNDPIGLE